MGNKSTKKNNKTKKNTIEVDIKSILKKITPARQKELMDFLFSNIIIDEGTQKNNANLIKNIELSFPFVIKFDYQQKKVIDSYFILISNDIIIVPTNHLYKDDKKPIFLSFSQFKIDIYYKTDLMIIENDNNNNIFSIIKIINKQFNFEKYYEIPDNYSNIEESEKFYINEKNEEESLGININIKEINDKKQICPRSPIYIKEDNKYFLAGIINENGEYYIFSSEELIDIKKKIESIEFKFKLYHIKKLEFNKININDNEMHYIFQFDLVNLEYLDLQKKNLTDKGIKALQNKSLSSLKYLNLSNNNITDEGLKYLNELKNLDELILLNLDKLSDDYFQVLEENYISGHIKNFHCDKRILSIKYINPKYNNFDLPNLTTLKIIDNSFEINLKLKELLELDKICSKIEELDLSKSNLSDNGMLRLTKNFSIFANIKLINFEGSKVTTYSQKYFEQIKKQNNNIIIKQKNLKPRIQKNIYKIVLGGSTVSGKTTFINTYMRKEFFQSYSATLGMDDYLITKQKYENKKFKVYDTSRWESRLEKIIRGYIRNIDGIILLFDLSKKEDFDGLPFCMNIITDYYELEEFPVMLIGNKADLEKKISNEEIEEFMKKYKFIKYFEVSSHNLSSLEESINFMLDFIYEKENIS